MTRQWVILDRDGVINHDSKHFIKSVDEWRPIDGSIEAIAELHKRGFKVAIATNQSGIARGLFGLDELEAMHNKMCTLVNAAGGEISAIYYCPHGPDDNCDCRKPKPGMLQQLAADHGVNLQQSVMLGDSLRDLQCAQAAGSQPILVRTGKGLGTEAQLQQYPELINTPVFDSLLAYVQSR